MKPLRRLETTPPDTFHRLQRGVLRYLSLSEDEFRALQDEQPECIVEDGDAVLIARPRSYDIDLDYSFASREDFGRRFPTLFARLLEALRPQTPHISIRFRLTDRNARSFVEPALFAQAFERTREWVQMQLEGLPEAPVSDDVAPGFLLRGARAGDVDAIVELDAAAFPTSWLTIDAAREMVARATVLRLLEDTATRRIAGFLQLRQADETTGYVSDIAIHPDYQRRGLGEAAMRWALAWFRERGLRCAALTVNTNNAAAIALYRKLGFAAGEVGLDYRRPVDEEEVRQVLEKRMGAHIRVRRR